jgi:hypothetical protein
MQYRESFESRIRSGLERLVEGLEQRAPRLEIWCFWIGAVLGVVAIVVTLLHHFLPSHSLTEDLIAIIAISIRTIHEWMHLPLADLATYASGPPLALSLILWLVKRINRWGGTKSR